jgi:hypothetical protein
MKYCLLLELQIMHLRYLKFALILSFNSSHIHIAYVHITWMCLFNNKTSFFLDALHHWRKGQGGSESKILNLLPYPPPRIH